MYDLNGKEYMGERYGILELISCHIEFVLSMYQLRMPKQGLQESSKALEQKREMKPSACEASRKFSASRN